MKRLLVVLLAAGCSGTAALPGDSGLPVADGAPPPSCQDAGGAVGPEATVAGAAELPSPTLRHLTIEWGITGDVDLDGVVTVRYRTALGTWRQGLPLRRIPAGSVEGFSWPDKHSGSLFDLEPDTTYEVELALADPDGGCEVRTLFATTRPIPGPMPGAPIIQVTPATFDAVAGAAQPGDVLELAAGTYPTFTFGADGLPGMPIVIRGTAGTVIDGDVRLDGRSHVHVDGLTVNGKIKFNGGLALAITRCTINTIEDGITTKTRAEDCYIADNIVTGATIWAETSLGVDGDNVGEGIEVTGPGHVIEHNRVTGFRDCISTIEDTNAVDQHSIDIVENDLEACADDGIEADFCFHNCRIVRNRLTNVFIGLSSQPGLGGPTWFIRNVMYNLILSAFKLQRGSVGDVGLHNTSMKNGDAFGIYTSDVFSRQWFRNNLFLGGAGGDFGGWSSGTGAVLELRSADPSGDYDYDGYGSTLGTFTGWLGDVAFASLAELRAGTSEAHAVEVDLSVFAQAVDDLAAPFPARAAPDLRPAAGGAAIDVGAPLSNVNDGYAGAGPDLGAYEAGSPLPVYGPRF